MTSSAQQPDHALRREEGLRARILRLPSWIALLAFAAILLLQIVLLAQRTSLTVDEADHLNAGYRYLTCGDFGWNPEHPPLLKMVAASPLLAMHIQDPLAQPCGFPNSRATDYAVGHDLVFANPPGMLTAARVASGMFALALLVVVWFAARWMFGTATAMVAASVLSFEPSVLAHSALVTNDVAAAFAYLAVIVCLYRYLTAPGAARLILCGVACGVALALKHSLLILAPVVALLMLLDPLFSPEASQRPRRMLRNLGAACLMAGIALATLWLAYGFRYTARPNAAPVWSNEYAAYSSSAMANKVIPACQQMHLLPQAYLSGLQDIFINAEFGRVAYLLGTTYRGGKVLYFPAAILIKSSLALLLLALLSTLAPAFWRQKRRELFFLGLPMLVFLAASMSSGLNIGVRHVLPVFPLLLLLGAAGAVALAKRFANGHYALAALLALNALLCLRAFPEYLSYGNELWGGPGNTYRYLADSNVDWGQALLEARSYIEHTKPASCLIIQDGSALSRDYGIPCQEIGPMRSDPPPEHFQGTLLVSSDLLHGLWQDRSAHGGDLVRGMTPVAKLGGSALLVYQGDFDLRSFAASYHLLLATQALNQRDPATALAEASTARQLDPDNYRSMIWACVALARSGQPAAAQAACSEGRRRMHADPLGDPRELLFVERFMEHQGIQPLP